MQKIWILIIFIIILSAGFGGYYFGISQKENGREKLISTTPSVIPSPIISSVLPDKNLTSSNPAEMANWNTYTDKSLGFSLKHPNNIKPETYNDGIFVLSLWGPTQKEDTEFFDGISISITKKPLAGKTLVEVVEEYRKGSEEIAGEKINPASPTIIGGVAGLTYQAMNNDYYFIPYQSDSYLEILNLTADPGALGYLDTATKILESITIIQ